MPRAHKQADILTAKRKRVRRTINSLKKASRTPCPRARQTRDGIISGGLNRS